MDIQWTGNLKDLVNKTASSDARTTFVDAKTGAKIRINIDGGDFLETDEPFYIEHGDNLYDAANRKEAIMILSNIRKGKKFPDMPDYTPKQRAGSKKVKAKLKRKTNTPTSVRGIRR